MKNISMILHLCMITLCLMSGCSSKEEVQKAKNEGIILLQDTENDPDPAIRREKQSTVKTDVAPNLMWSQPSPGPMYYDTIAEYCEELREDGFSDWRAPTTGELKSIMKECSGFKEGSSIFYTEKESDTLKSDVNGFFLYEGCFWSFNEKENDRDWFNGYGMISGKSCLADPDWHPCRPCKRDLCHVACVRESSPKDFAGEKIIEIKKAVVPDKLQWSESTMSEKKNYSASLLSERHIMYTAAKEICDESWVCEEEEERKIPCGYLYRDCMDDTFGVHDAYSYCESLREGGFSDWRQPTIEELKSLHGRYKKPEKDADESFFLAARSSHGVRALTANSIWDGSHARPDRFGWIYSPVLDLALYVPVINHDTNVTCVRDRKEDDNKVKTKNKPVKSLPNSKSLKWSAEAADPMTWEEAKNYCADLAENNHSDWRLPNIDELRTLIQNCDKTKAGGKCRISENRQCLNEKCWSKDCNGCGRINTLPAKTEYYELGEETKKQLLEEINDPKFSRIKSNDAFWSSTLDPENTKEAWGVDFLNARVGHMTILIDAYDRGGAHSADFPYILDYKLKVVCVRNNQ